MQLDPADPKIGKLVRLARERQIRDRETAESRGFYFDEKAADKAVAFFALLRHSSGEYNGQHFILEPWQDYDIVRQLFGWKHIDTDYRRFRTAYLEMARKEGKTALAAGIGNMMFLADGEAAAEVYTAATKRSQAKIAHTEAKAQIRGLIKDDPRLKKAIVILRDNMSMEHNRSLFVPLGADRDGLDGLNVHCAIVDEIHAHGNAQTWSDLDTGTGARRQPLMLGITTAGKDRNTICWALHSYAVKVLEGKVVDDSFFAYICALDEGDDWKDESVWIKANPNLGVTVKLVDLRNKFAKALESNTFEAEFKQKHLNMWTQRYTRWLKMSDWDQCVGNVSIEDLRGRECYGGLDVAPKRDLSAFVLIFPIGGKFKLLAWFWMPGENIVERGREDSLPYDVWARQGLIRATHGNVTDFGEIRDEMLKINDMFDIKEVAFDPSGATEIATGLIEGGMAMRVFNQNIKTFNEPTQKFEAAVVGHLLEHGGNAVLSAHAEVAGVYINVNDAVRPVKDKYCGRIDGIVAGIQAMSCIIGIDPAEACPYEHRGVLTLDNLAE